MPRKKRGNKNNRTRSRTSGTGGGTGANEASSRSAAADAAAAAPANVLSDPSSPATNQNPLEEPLLPPPSSLSSPAEPASKGINTGEDQNDVESASPTATYTSFPRHRRFFSDAHPPDEIVPLATDVEPATEPLEATLIKDAAEFNCSFEPPNLASEDVNGDGDVVRIEAPASLPPNFTFVATLADGRAFAVTTHPDGGVVQRGQMLTVPYPTTFLATTAVPPHGHWKDGLCDCLSVGCCHPTVWVSWLCPLVAVGQVNTRLRLDWLGRTVRSPTQVKFTFGILLTVTVLHFVATNVWTYLGHNVDPVYYRVGSAFGLCLMLFQICSIARTRYQLRRRYEDTGIGVRPGLLLRYLSQLRRCVRRGILLLLHRGPDA